MGASHARAYAALDEFELVGVVSRGPESREALSAELGGVRLRFAPIGRPACSRCAAQGSWTPAACMGPALLDRLVATGTSHKFD